MFNCDVIRFSICHPQNQLSWKGLLIKIHSTNCWSKPSVLKSSGIICVKVFHQFYLRSCYWVDEAKTRKQNIKSLYWTSSQYWRMMTYDQTIRTDVPCWLDDITAHHVILYITLTYKLPYCTYYLSPTLHITLPYILPYCTYHHTLPKALPYILPYSSIHITLPYILYYPTYRLILYIAYPTYHLILQLTLIITFTLLFKSPYPTYSLTIHINILYKSHYSTHSQFPSSEKGILNCTGLPTL